MKTQLTAKLQRPPQASRSGRATAAPTSATKRQRTEGPQRSELGLVQPRTEPSRSATRVGSGSPRGQHVRHTATRHPAQRSAGASSRIEMRGKSRSYVNVMNDKKQTPREFFTDEEYTHYLEEKIFILENDPLEEKDYPPHYFMYYAYTVFNIPREEMMIDGPEVRLTIRASKSMAQQCLQDPNSSPEDHDRIMDVITVLNGLEK